MLIFRRKFAFNTNHSKRPNSEERWYCLLPLFIPEGRSTRVVFQRNWSTQKQRKVILPNLIIIVFCNIIYYCRITIHSNGTLQINDVGESNQGWYNCVGMKSDSTEIPQSYTADLHIACKYVIGN